MAVTMFAEKERDRAAAQSVCISLRSRKIIIRNRRIVLYY